MNDFPWDDQPPPMPVASAEVVTWARALCRAEGTNPDKLIGFPAMPRWCSYISYARLALNAKALIEAEA